MFRFNNPDALLTLVLTAAAYATIRAIDAGRTRWLVLAGALVGFGFITKMMQAFILMPVLALVYLLAGPPKLGRRIVQLVWCGVALVVSAGWWVAAVTLTPAADRPYVGGSTDNSLLNLIFGYNGIGRLSGSETGSVGGGGGPGGTSMWGPTGWDRLFLRSFGGQISWLIPGALIGLVAALWLTRRAPRTDRIRAGFLLFGGWLLLTGLIFSFAQGIIHPYYTVVLAPAVGALVGMGSSYLWQRREAVVPRLALRRPSAPPPPGPGCCSGGARPGTRCCGGPSSIAGVLAIVVVAPRPGPAASWPPASPGFGIAAVLAGPTAYAVDTASTPHCGVHPVGRAGDPGRRVRTGWRIRPAADRPGRIPRWRRRVPRWRGGRRRPRRRPPGRHDGRRLPRWRLPGSEASPVAGFPGGGTGRFGGAARTGGFGGGAAGGLLNSSTPGRQLVALLEAGASGYTWVAATTGANSAAGYQLATDEPVMAIGGFNGTDPSPTLAQFQTYVAEGQDPLLHRRRRRRPRRPGPTTSHASAIASWVERALHREDGGRCDRLRPDRRQPLTLPRAPCHDRRPPRMPWRGAPPPYRAGRVMVNRAGPPGLGVSRAVSSKPNRR